MSRAVDQPTSGSGTEARLLASGGGRIEVTGLAKWYGDNQVLRGIDLEIEAGEFFSLLGPSGCGKTTTLRLIGGFEPIEHGSVRIDGAEMAGVAPEKRPVNTVFQSYALFPHQTVEQNVGFGLRFIDCTKSERRRRVGEALDLVRLSEFASRRPHQLSGGQQQRVALARALILRPKVLLLDEPLGALDAKLRRTLQFELKALHREVGITFVYVTHDQEEALTMSDRIAVIRDGQIEQVGAPRDVYDEPATAYVADFLGLANLLPATVTDAGHVSIDDHVLATATDGFTGPCTLLVRPERFRVGAPGGAGIPAVVQDVVFVGATTHIVVAVGDRHLQVVVANDGAAPIAPPGAAVTLHVLPDAIRVLPT